jgi:hypothetical protein
MYMYMDMYMTIYDCICIICICIHVHVQEFMPGRGTALLWAYCRRYVYRDIHIANELRQLRLGIYYTTNPINYILIIPLIVGLDSPH